jgi:prepilin-type N-terminal cleavage/methylation domain-containing protein
MSAGFTLTEILVALMVLGATAGTMSTTMGTAFKSYERLESSSSDLRKRSKLNEVMAEVSGRTWLADGKAKERILGEIPVNGPYFSKLVIENIGAETWVLSAVSEQVGKTEVFTSGSELRFRALGTRRKTGVNRTAPYDYYTLVLERLNPSAKNELEDNLDDGWQVVGSTALKVDVNPACRFDIVGRQCR